MPDSEHALRSQIEKEREFVEAAMAYNAHQEEEQHRLDAHEAFNVAAFRLERIELRIAMHRAYRALVSEKPPEEGAK